MGVCKQNFKNLKYIIIKKKEGRNRKRICGTKRRTLRFYPSLPRATATTGTCFVGNNV